MIYPVGFSIDWHLYMALVDILICLSFEGTSPGGYGFGANVWRTSDNCYNIDFKGALDSVHCYCCGSCDTTASR